MCVYPILCGVGTGILALLVQVGQDGDDHNCGDDDDEDYQDPDDYDDNHFPLQALEP